MKRREFLKAAMTTSAAVTAGSPLSLVPGRMTAQTVASGLAPLRRALALETRRHPHSNFKPILAGPGR